MKANKILSLIFSILTFHYNLLLSHIYFFFFSLLFVAYKSYLVFFFLLFDNFYDCKGWFNLQNFSKK